MRCLNKGVSIYRAPPTGSRRSCDVLTEGERARERERGRASVLRAVLFVRVVVPSAGAYHPGAGSWRSESRINGAPTLRAPGAYILYTHAYTYAEFVGGGGGCRQLPQRRSSKPGERTRRAGSR